MRPPPLFLFLPPPGPVLHAAAGNVWGDIYPFPSRTMVSFLGWSRGLGCLGGSLPAGLLFFYVDSNCNMSSTDKP